MIDPSLRLLWRLRLKAFFRRLGKNLRSPKGIILTLVGLLVFAPMLASRVMFSHEGGQDQVEAVRRYGPLLLLAYGVLTLLTSSGGQALFFSPPEIDFLFAGPYSRRALVAYKIGGVVFGVFFSSIFFVFAFVSRGIRYLPAYLAIVLAMLFFQLVAMAITLASSTVAAFAANVRRRVVLAMLVALALASVWTAGAEVFSLPPMEALARVEASPALRVATLPFRPFVYTYTSSRIWPDLLGWSIASLAMVVVAGAVVFAIDAQYMETAAASSSRIYSQIERMRRGGGLLPGRVGTGRFSKARLGMLPFWGGVGPVLWRQLLSALRDPARVLVATLAIVAPAVAVIAFDRNRHEGPGLPIYVSLGVAAYLALLFSALVGFDFRGDVDRMEELKAMPIEPLAIVVGQVLTPVLIFNAPVWISVAIATAWHREVRAGDLPFVAMMTPFAFTMVGLENLLFLLFPTRSNAANPADFAAVGRQVILLFAKFTAAALICGLAATVAFGAFWLGLGRLGCLWLAAGVGAGLAALLVPALVVAFTRYDVAGDAPG